MKVVEKQPNKIRGNKYRNSHRGSNSSCSFQKKSRKPNKSWGIKQNTQYDFFFIRSEAKLPNDKRLI